MRRRASCRSVLRGWMSVGHGQCSVLVVAEVLITPHSHGLRLSVKRNGRLPQQQPAEAGALAHWHHIDGCYEVQHVGGLVFCRGCQVFENQTEHAVGRTVLPPWRSFGQQRAAPVGYLRPEEVVAKRNWVGSRRRLGPCRSSGRRVRARSVLRRSGSDSARRHVLTGAGRTETPNLDAA
jgi:hypothetical protein